MNNYKEGTAKIHNNILKLMKGRKQGLRCFAIRDLYQEAFGKYYSESGFSARLREMKKIECDLSDYTYKYCG